MVAMMLPNARHERTDTSKRSAAGERSARWRCCARGRSMDSKRTRDAVNSHRPPTRACGPVQPHAHGDGDASHYANGFTRAQPLRQKAGTGDLLKDPAEIRSTAFDADPRLPGAASPAIRSDEPVWLSGYSERRTIPAAPRVRAALTAPADTPDPATALQARPHDPSDLRG